MKQKPNIEKLRQDTEQISSKTVKALGYALLDFYLKLEKIPFESTLKTDSYALFRKIDDIVAMWRDEPWKSMTSILQKAKWFHRAYSLADPLTTILAALPKQIHASGENEKYTFMALKGFCIACDRIRKNSTNSLNPTLKPIILMIDDVNAALDRKDINLDWIDPSQDEALLELSADNPASQEVRALETEIEEIAHEQSILARLFQIGKLVREKIELHEKIPKKTELQVQSFDFLKRLIKTTNPQALNLLTHEIFKHGELSGNDQADNTKFKARTDDVENILGKYSSANNSILVDNNDSAQVSSEQNLEEMTFEVLADLHTRIRETAAIIHTNIDALKQPDNLSTLEIHDQSSKSTNKDLGWWGIVPGSSYWWGSKKPTGEEAALLAQNQRLQKEVRALKEQNYEDNLALYHAKVEILESELTTLNLAAGAIEQVLKNTEEKYKIILRHLIEQLKDSKQVLVPIAEQPEPTPESLKLTHKALKLLLRLIKFFLSPIVTLVEIISFLKRKFGHSPEEFAEHDNERYYENFNAPESTYAGLLGEHLCSSDPSEEAEEGYSEAVEEENHNNRKDEAPALRQPTVIVEDDGLINSMSSTAG